MRIVEHTPERLRLRYRPLKARIFFSAMAALFVAMAWFARHDAPGISLAFLLVIAILLLGVWLTWVDCVVEFERATNSVTVTTRGMRASRSEVHRLSDIREVVLEHAGRRAGDRGPVMRRPVLAMRKKGVQVPLSPAYKAGRAAEVVQAAVIAWLGPSPRRD